MSDLNLQIDMNVADSFDIGMQSDSLDVEMLEGIPIAADDYNGLRNKPKIEGVTLEGDKTYEELNMNRLTNIEIENILN